MKVVGAVLLSAAVLGKKTQVVIEGAEESKTAEGSPWVDKQIEAGYPWLDNEVEANPWLEAVEGRGEFSVRQAILEEVTLEIGDILEVQFPGEARHGCVWIQHGATGSDILAIRESIPEDGRGFAAYEFATLEVGEETVVFDYLCPGAERILRTAAVLARVTPLPPADDECWNGFVNGEKLYRYGPEAEEDVVMFTMAREALGRSGLRAVMSLESGQDLLVELPTLDEFSACSWEVDRRSLMGGQLEMAWKHDSDEATVFFFASADRRGVIKVDFSCRCGGEAAAELELTVQMQAEASLRWIEANRVVQFPNSVETTKSRAVSMTKNVALNDGDTHGVLLGAGEDERSSGA